MDTDCSNGKSPNFKSLAEVMEHFSKVPFETFKKDLNEWFLNALTDQKSGLLEVNPGVNLAGLLNFAENMFKVAEEMDQARLN